MKKFLFLCICFIIFIVGCENETREGLGCFSENCKLVYDGFQYLTYDTKLFSSTGFIDPTDNEFQYRFHKNSEYITSGNSITNQFKIMRRDKERLQILYSHKSNTEFIAPFAVVNNQHIFSIVDNTEHGPEFIGLFQLNGENELQQLKTENNEKSEKIFWVSISANDNIFTLLYEEDEQNLYKTNLALSEFKLIAKDVRQELSSLFGEPCYIKDQKLFCSQEIIKELDTGIVLAWVVGDKYILEVDQVGNYEVNDIKDKKMLASGTGFIGFDENPSKVIIYSDGKMERLESY